MPFGSLCNNPTNGELYGIARGDSIYVIHDTLPEYQYLTHIPYPSGSRVVVRPKAMMMDANATFYFASTGRMSKWEPKTKTLAFWPEGPEVRRTRDLGGTANEMIWDEQTNIGWMATWGGLVRIDLIPGLE